MAKHKKKSINNYLDDILTVEEQEELENGDDVVVTAWKNDVDEEELVVETTEQADYNNTVKLVNLIGARVTLSGKVTGQLYRWERAGAVVEVDERDAPDLLAKTLGSKRCCGSANKNLVFEIYKE